MDDWKVIGTAARTPGDVTLRPLRLDPPELALEWARASVGTNARVLAIRRLEGGISHANHLVRIAAGRDRIDLVLRRWVRPEWQVTDPDFSAAHEARTLRFLAAARIRRIAVRELVGVDPDGAACGAPALLETRIPGRPVRRPRDRRSFVRQLAKALDAIHAASVDTSSMPAYRPYAAGLTLAPPPWTSRPTLWKRAIELAQREMPPFDPCFIHRDFHPGNALWLHGRLTGIVDWSAASVGPPLVDVAHMRANLAMSFGRDASDAFLEAWRAIASVEAVEWHPYWDLRVAVDFLPDFPYVATAPPLAMRRLEKFMAAAVATLGR